MEVAAAVLGRVMVFLVVLAAAVLRVMLGTVLEDRGTHQLQHHHKGTMVVTAFKTMVKVAAAAAQVQQVQTLLTRMVVMVVTELPQVFLALQ
jgi:hypothetical protein